MNANSSTVSERIYTAIRNDILNKTLVSGEKLTIKSILYEEAQNGRLTDAARKIRIQSTIFSNQYEIKEENRRGIRSKGHHIGHGFGISPSADGNRTAVVSGHFPVSGQQGAQHRAIRRPPGRLFSFLRPRGLRTKTDFIDFAGRRTQTEFIGFAGRRTQTAPAAGLFAPPCPQILMSSFRGAKTPAAVPNRCRGFSISLILCYILISSMPAFPHTHRRCTAYP